MPPVYEKLELLLFSLVTAVYLAAWLSYLVGWRNDSSRKIQLANKVLWAGFAGHTLLLGLRYYQAEHIPVLTAFEFVNAFSFLVVLVFLLFAFKEKNRALGVFLLPVALSLMIYAAFMSRTIEPEFPIFSGLLLKVHVLVTLLGYAAWSITFAASICFLYLSKKNKASPGLFDQLAYRAAFFAFCFLTLGIISGALWADKVFGQLWFWDPKETWSFITWLIFLAYLHARYTLDWKGRRAAILAIIGFIAVLFTYVGVDFLLPQIHGVQT
jgi:ABC-type transport system involved in cytochrome c biogenesis permease subunit